MTGATNNAQPIGQALPAGTRLEEFVIERVLGTGGFGITYLAEDTSISRRVVIKENLPAEFSWRETTTGTVGPRNTTSGDLENFEWSLKNFLREAETLAALEHPGIVRLLRMFEANGTAYFVMPFVEGVAFDELLKSRKERNKPFSEDELKGFLEHVLDALTYLHERGIYHRDIKPGNILITKEGVPVLIDFGSARQLLSERSLTVVESAGYTPFEQLQSRGNIGPWSDLYALGATLVKAITFEAVPKSADRVIEDPWEGLAGNPFWEGRYDHELLASIDRALAVDPKNRWQSAKEWRDFENSAELAPVSPAVTSVLGAKAPSEPVRPAERDPGYASPRSLPAHSGQSPALQPEVMQSNKRPAPRRTGFWSARSLKATAGAAGISFVGRLIRPETAIERMGMMDRDLSFIFGETLGVLIVSGVAALVIALVIAAIMAACKKPFPAALSWAYSLTVLTISGWMLLANWVSQSNESSTRPYSTRSEIESARSAMAGLEDDLQRVISETVDSDGIPRKTDLYLKSDKPATEDVGRMRELIQAFFNDMIKLQNEYLADLEADGLDTLIDAERIAQDQEFRESRRRLTKIRGSVKRARTNASALLTGFPKRVEEYDFDADSSESALRGFRSGADQVLPLFDEMWDLEVETVDHMEELINHLERTRLYWEPDDGIFAFERDRDLERFNAIMEKIGSCVERQTEIKESSLTRAVDRFGELKSALP